MSRDANIPLVLWITAAIVAHIGGGGGAVEVAQNLHDRADLRGMVHALRAELRPADTTFEVITENVEPTAVDQNAAAPDKDAPADPNDPTANAERDPKAPPKPRDPAAPKPPPKPPEASAKATPPAPPQAEKPKVDVPVPAQAAPPPPPPPADNRIAIRQHADKDQPDNPEANRIADDANHVKEESVAHIRSHDQDDADPSIGGRIAAGPRREEGNSDHTKEADSEDHKGNEKHAPGEKDDASTTATHSNPAPPSAGAPPQAVAKGPPQSAPGAKSPGGGGKLAAAAQPAAPPPSPGGAGPTSPEVTSGEKGGYTLDPANPGGDGTSRRAGRKQAAAPYQSPVKVGQIGLGAPGALGGPNLNLTIPMVEAAVGSDKLKAMRAADGAARRTAHMGSTNKNGFDRLRAAIENYEPSVKEGNQTALNAARVPFATYINTIHNRLHPIFAEEFLESLDNLPQGHALNGDLVTHIEIVLSKDEGRIVKMGVTKASGSTAFDMVAMNSVQRASPYGKAPDAIVSPDGNVYLHWEFHRDPFDACTTRNARPFILKSAPNVGEKPATPRHPSGSVGDERGAGALLPLAPR